MEPSTQLLLLHPSTPLHEFADEAVAKLQAWMFFHYAASWLAVILGGCGWVYAVMAMVVSELVAAGLMQASLWWKVQGPLSALVESNRRAVNRMEQPYQILTIAVTAELVAALLFCLVVGILLCVFHEREIGLLLMIACCTAAIYSKDKFTKTMPRWVGLVMAGASAIPESSLDGNTAGGALRNKMCGYEDFFLGTPFHWLSQFGGAGGILVIVLLVAHALQLACLRVIIKNYYEQKEKVPLHITFKRISKFCVCLDLAFLTEVMLMIAEEEEQSPPPDKTTASLKQQVDSERFKVKGCYENILQGWVTAIVLQVTWLQTPLLPWILNSVGFVMGLKTIWSNAHSFWVWHGSSGVWLVSKYVHMVLALGISGAAVVRFTMIPICGVDHGYIFMSGCVPLACRSSNMTASLL